MKRDVDCETYTVTQAAKILGIGRDTLYNAVNTGEVPSMRIGKLIRIPRTAIDRLLGVPKK